MRERQSGLAPLLPPFTTIWPKGQMGYFKNAPSENRWANRGAQFLFVVVVGGGSVPSLRQEARQCLVIECGRMRERERKREKERREPAERQRQRDGEKRTLGGGAERDREGVKASRDTSRCQTHRHTAATDSSSQLRLQAQLDTGNE